MPLITGRNIVLSLRVEDDMVPIAGLHRTSITFDGRPAGIDPATGDGWRRMLPGGGLRQMTVRGDGLFTADAAMSTLRDLVFSGAPGSFDIAVPGLGRFAGEFHVTRLELSGEWRGEGEVGLSLSSTGPVSVITE